MRRGVTLLEIIVVMGIIAIVTAISLPYYRNFISMRSVDYWKDMIMSDIQRTKYRAILQEQCWGIDVLDENSYRLVLSNDGTAFKDPARKYLRNMNKDFAGTTKFTMGFTPGIPFIYFDPHVQIGTGPGSYWQNVGVFRNGSQQTSDFEFTIQSGKFTKTIKVTKNGDCFCTQ
jgi:prepilin-type N-terminal cleavage/methylation domain-containing protein